MDAVLIGAGLRGRFTYGGYARMHPDRLRIVALAEADPARRELLAGELGLAPDALFDDWRPLLGAARRARVVIIATGDTEHVEPALAAFGSGYHVLLEKPIALEPVGCQRVVDAAERSGRILQISHVLRYTPFYERVAEIVASGRLGRLVTIDLKEHVGTWHMAHSFVRGKFRKRDIAAPFLLAKSCHDLDLMTWLVGTRPLRVASFGSLAHFRREDAPSGAPERCTQGCPVQAECPWDAVRSYADPPDALASSWPWTDVSSDPSRAARLRALETGRYGRCVYHCDNDVLDHQSVIVEFEDGVTATFSVHGFASQEQRTLRMSGTRGELRGRLHDGLIEVTRHGSLATQEERVEGSPLDHFGGDRGLLEHFTGVAARDAVEEVRASGRVALASHWLGFAAEHARETGSVVELDRFVQRTLEEAR